MLYSTLLYPPITSLWQLWSGELMHWENYLPHSEARRRGCSSHLEKTKSYFPRLPCQGKCICTWISNADLCLNFICSNTHKWVIYPLRKPIVTSLPQPPFCPCLLKAIWLQSDFQWKFSFPFSSVKAKRCTGCPILVCPHRVTKQWACMWNQSKKKASQKTTQILLTLSFSLPLRRYILEQLFS